MNSPYRRNKGVNEALAERMPVVTGADTETFAALYERTFPRVYAYVASLLRDRSAAEDVTAQAFERAYRRRATYRTRRGSHEAWLFGIARNFSAGLSNSEIAKVLQVSETAVGTRLHRTLTKLRKACHE